MREALARTRLRPARRSPRASARPHALAAAGDLASGALRQFRIRPATTMAGAAFAALMTGIALNALVMQKPHHAAPSAEVPHGAAAAPAAPEPLPRPAPPAPLPPANAAADPIAHLPNNGGTQQAAAAPRKPAAAGAADPIGHLLKSTAPADAGDPVAELLKRQGTEPPAASEKTILSAQHALLKLGYVVKPDGVFRQTTRRALEHFEKEHHLPAGDRLTPKLMEALTAAVAAQAE